MTYQEICDRLDRIEDAALKAQSVELADAVAALRLDIEIDLRREADKSAAAARAVSKTSEAA